MPRYVLPHRAVDQFELTRRLVDSGQQVAEHDGVGAGDERLHDVAGRSRSRRRR